MVLGRLYFQNLKIHDSVHSFVRGRSIVTNAQSHVGCSFVGCVDIEEFFGNITSKLLNRHLMHSGVEPRAADLLVRLCTNGDHLPQGAPTSPVLSNSILYDFESFCKELSLRYSRYADDITISGEDRTKIMRAMSEGESILKTLYDLKLRRDKTRIANRNGQQRVTGVVVNYHALPPRVFRRRVRAIFHHASLHPAEYSRQVADLHGYIGFLKSFPKLREGGEVAAYGEILRNLHAISQRVSPGQGRRTPR
jgi:RNA-directed DNA polymerase